MDDVKVRRGEMSILLENQTSYLRKKTLFKVSIYSQASYLRMAYFSLYKNTTALYKLLGLDIET